MRVTNIYRDNTFINDDFGYVGLLRNQKRFSIGDNVFFSHSGNTLHRGKIIGIELKGNENPEYYYKIRFSEDNYTGEPKEATLICDNIFFTVDEAEKSARTNLYRRCKLQRERIEQYFKQFKK